jgi:ubiquinone/menaquinone biosynthesis C-methylase UbiE
MLKPLTRLLRMSSHLQRPPGLSILPATMSHGNPANKVDKAAIEAHFEKVAQTYEKDGQGLQNAICRTLLSMASELGHPVTKSSVVLDNASGPGILTGELLKQCPPDEVPELHAADFSAAMIRVLDAKGWGEKYGVKAAVMDAQVLQYPDEMFTHVFMSEYH